jgi:hypothetical protein
MGDLVHSFDNFTWIYKYRISAGNFQSLDSTKVEYYSTYLYTSRFRSETHTNHAIPGSQLLELFLRPIIRPRWPQRQHQKTQVGSGIVHSDGHLKQEEIQIL